MKKKDYMLSILLVITGLVVLMSGFWIKAALPQVAQRYPEEKTIAIPMRMIADRNEISRILFPEKLLFPVRLQVSQPVEKPKGETLEQVVAEHDPNKPLAEYGVDESYFDDALFIGDSRTVGLGAYAPLGEADYFSTTGMTVYGVFAAEAEMPTDKNGEEEEIETVSVTLEELLTENSYKKIYLGLGINECGAPLDSYDGAYRELIQKLKLLEPDAAIIVQAIMTVGREKADSASYFSLEYIGTVNNIFQGLTDIPGVYFLDPNPVVADEEGYLPDEMSWDGCHLYAQYYPLWAEFLCQNAIALPEK